MSASVQVLWALNCLFLAGSCPTIRGYFSRLIALGQALRWLLTILLLTKVAGIARVRQRGSTHPRPLLRGDRNTEQRRRTLQYPRSQKATSGANYRSRASQPRSLQSTRKPPPLPSELRDQQHDVAPAPPGSTGRQHGSQPPALIQRQRRCLTLDMAACAVLKHRVGLQWRTIDPWRARIHHIDRRLRLPAGRARSSPFGLKNTVIACLLTRIGARC
jgi:hypothetical protein